MNKSQNYIYLVFTSIAFVVLITGISFYPCLNSDFTNWDENECIVNNDMIRSLSTDNISNIFSFTDKENYKNYIGIKSIYIPLTVLSFAIEYKYFGLSSKVFHTTNYILHLINCILVFIVIMTISGNFIASFITSLLFGIHPLHVESVAWIFERKDVLYSLFFLLSLFFYLLYRKKTALRYIFYSLSITTFILSILSKPMAMTLPAVLILIDYYLEKDLKKGCLIEKIPFFILTFLSIVITSITFANYRLASGAEINPLVNNYLIQIINCFQNAGYGLLFYFEKTFLPIKLSCIYPDPLKFSMGSLAFFRMTPLIAAIMLSLAFIIARYSRKITFGIVFFLITISPVIQIIPSIYRSVADRFTYIPLIGIFFIFGEGFSSVIKTKKEIRAFLWVFLLLITIIFSYLSWKQCNVWYNSQTLWTNTIKYYPELYFAYNNRANYHVRDLNYINPAQADRAMSDYNEAIRLYPKYIEAYNNRGVLYLALKDHKRALKDFNTAIAYNPNMMNAYNNRAIVYFELKRFNEAWVDVRLLKSVNFPIDEEFIINLKRESGQDH